MRVIPRPALRVAVLAFLAAVAQPWGAPAAETSARGPVTNLPLPRFVSIRAETANARRGPSLDQRVDWEFLQRGLPLEITAEYGQWRKVRDAEGAGGWVHQSLLSGRRTVVIVGSGPVPLRAETEDGAAIRALAEPRAVARLDACEAAWCRISADGLDGWVPRAALWGVGPEEALD